jgi:hypothetical protein
MWIGVTPVWYHQYGRIRIVSYLFLSRWIRIRITGCRPPPLREAKAGRIHLSQRITPSSPLGYASDIAKLYQI